MGRLVLGHTARRVLVGGSRQVIIRTASEDASAGYWARLPPSTYVDSIIPLYSLKGKGWLAPRQSCSRYQIELVSTARLGDPTVGPRHAPTPTSSHSNTPSQLWAGSTDPVLHGVAYLADGDYHVSDSQAVGHLLGCTARPTQLQGEIGSGERLG